MAEADPSMALQAGAGIGWATDLAALLTQGPVAMLTVLATEGSAPRGAGTRMLVTGSALSGTIGGGRLEWRAVEQARAILALPPGDWRVQDYPLGPLLGQCCGGRVRLLVEHVDPDTAGWLGDVRAGATLVSRLEKGRIARRVDPDGKAPALLPPARGERPGTGTLLSERIGEARRPVHLFGAGHVGQAIARALAPLPFSLAWFDTRPDFAEVPGVVHMEEDALPACAAHAPADAAVLILTHDHGIDYRLTAAALSGPAGFVGLIGSATKRARFLSRLAADGIDAARLVSPIGLPGIEGKEPSVIAIAVAAQLLALRPQEGPA